MEKALNSTLQYGWELKAKTSLAIYPKLLKIPQKKQTAVLLSLCRKQQSFWWMKKENNRCVAEALLEPFEMQIDVAANAKQALEMVQKKKYDLVFMDHFIPIMDGAEATQEIRALENDHFQQLPIIALTAAAVQGVKEEFLQTEMNDFVSKPIVTEEITQALLHWIPKEKICKNQ